MDSKGAIVQNARIPVGKPSAVEIAFVPKTVGFLQHLLFVRASCLNCFFTSQAWEKPSITNRMMINREM